MQDANRLKSIEISNDCFRCVTRVGSHFMSGCTSLSTIDISMLCNTTSISDAFLSGCSSLTSIDLSSLSKVVETGVCFMKGCSSLTTIDITALNNLKRINVDFLAACSSLTSITTTGSASTATLIGYNFLRGCSSLTFIDLSPFVNVTAVGAHFLAHCTSLRADADTLLIPLKNVDRVADYFMRGTLLTLPANLDLYSPEMKGAIKKHSCQTSRCVCC